MAEDISLEGLFDELAEKVKKQNPNVNIERIRSAFEMARDSHEGQIRRDGTPYVTHPVAVANIVAVEMGLDEDSIVSALLHDVIEDTDISYADIVKKFGVTVADLVNGVTKLTRVQYTSKEDEQMENLRKMLLAMAKDIRVILIKIADRLHNMRTMEYQTEPKQRAKSLETMQIYAPIAHRLGIQRAKWELEDLSLIYLDPIGYNNITRSIESKRETMDAFMKSIEKQISERLRENNIKAVIASRIKHVYSIYRKMYAQNLDLEQVLDLYAFRVIVETIADCYNVLGQIHDMFNPLPGRFKDYISMPKPNMYQSLHTTVIGKDGITFEVQIRTERMHMMAEYGIAAHWKYKSGGAGVGAGDTEKFAWIRNLLENQQNSEASDFFSDLKIDMFDDEVFVFTPQGDVKCLPSGATPIDFAYGIHSAVGNSMVAAKVNERQVPFSYKLQNGDKVEIETSKSSPGPSRDWLKIVKSGSAKAKIRQWFKNERREENIVQGKAMFDGELKRNNLSPSDVSQEDIIPLILKKLAVSSMDDMYASIGYGGMTATRAVNKVKDELTKAVRANHKTALDKLNEQIERNERLGKKPPKPNQGVLVEGVDNCLIKFSRCCTPVPGDDIIGFITRGHGVSIHRTDCVNYLNSIGGGENAVPNDEDKGRWIAVQWAGATPESYNTTLKILAKRSEGVVLDVVTVLNSLSAKVTSLNARNVGKDKSTATVSIEVADTTELRNIMAKLKTIQGVSDVSRTGA